MKNKHSEIRNAVQLGCNLQHKWVNKLGDGTEKERRNVIARTLFKNPKRRTITFGTNKVCTEYDRSSRNWATITTNAQGNQVGDIDYTGNTDDAAVAHLWALIALFGIKPQTEE